MCQQQKKQNLKKFQKSKKIIFVCQKRKKMLFCYFFPFQEISIKPELSSPLRFRIQGGGGGGTVSVTQEHLKRLKVKLINYKKIPQVKVMKEHCWSQSVLSLLRNRPNCFANKSRFLCLGQNHQQHRALAPNPTNIAKQQSWCAVALPSVVDSQRGKPRTE